MANKIPEEYKGKNAFQLIHTVIAHAFSLFFLPSLSHFFFLSIQATTQVLCNYYINFRKKKNRRKRKSCLFCHL